MEPHNAIQKTDLQNLESRCRQMRFLEQLRELSPQAGQYFTRVFDTLAKTKGVNPEVLLLVESGIGYHEAYVLTTALVEVIQKLVAARAEGDFKTFYDVRAVLDDINVAVNAWANRLCLHHSDQSVNAYRQLRDQALNASCN
jgi:hypothetical protein